MHGYGRTAEAAGGSTFIMGLKLTLAQQLTGQCSNSTQLPSTELTALCILATSTHIRSPYRHWHIGNYSTGMGTIGDLLTQTSPHVQPGQSFFTCYDHWIGSSLQAHRLEHCHFYEEVQHRCHE
jgi:hypothetical protein